MKQNSTKTGKRVTAKSIERYLVARQRAAQCRALQSERQQMTDGNRGYLRGEVWTLKEILQDIRLGRVKP